MKISTITLSETDDTFVLKFKLLLKKTGINTQKFKHFKTTEEALQFYKNEKMDEASICFVDVNIQGILSIVDLIFNLKRMHSNLYIGVMSFSGGVVAQNAAEKTGAHFFMKKEGSFEELEERMKNFKTNFIINTPNEKFYTYE